MRVLLLSCLAFCVVGCYAAATVNHAAEFWKAGAGGLRLTDTEADTYVKHVEGIVAPLAKPPAKYHHPENAGKIKEFADYSHRKDEWNPSKFTVPGKAAPHYNMQKFRMIVTSIRDDDPTFKSPAYWSLFNPDFQKDLLLSCSVIDQHHTNTWFLSGFVLKVPAQNVIAASHRDLMLGNGVYLNNAPSVLVDEVKSKLKRATDATYWKAHSVHPREFYVQGTADKPTYRLLSPEEVLAQSATDYEREYAATDTTHEVPIKGAVQHDDHNEIGVLGTSLDGKHQIEIVAVWYKVRSPSEGVKSGQWLVTPQRMALLEHVAKTHNLPLIPIFDHGKDPKPKKEKKEKKDKKPKTEKKQKKEKKEKKEKAPAADKKPEDHHDASHPEHLAPNTH